MEVIYRKSDLLCVGTIADNMTFEKEFEKNILPFHGGNKEDYSVMETDKRDFHIERDRVGNVVVIENLIEPTIIEEPVDEEKAFMAEAIIQLSTELENVKTQLNQLIGR